MRARALVGEPPATPRWGSAAIATGSSTFPRPPRTAPPVLLFFHGAGGTGRRELRAVLSAADRYGTVVAAPDSRTRPGTSSPVASSDRTSPSPTECSTGSPTAATSTSSAWRSGGSLTGRPMRCRLGSPTATCSRPSLRSRRDSSSRPRSQGRPRIFISHGQRDSVLPIDLCGRRLAAGLSLDGYAVTFHEFDGGHSVPVDVAALGFRWWVND